MRPPLQILLLKRSRSSISYTCRRHYTVLSPETCRALDSQEGSVMQRGTLNYICAQVAALETLVRVASGPEAGLLGSGWVTILRCLSLLEALQVRRTYPEKLQSTCKAC